MKAPRFWSNPPGRPGWQARLLAPAAWLWRLAAWWRGRGVLSYRAPVPVVCIGNLTAGGAGKTPMVAALLERLVARRAQPPCRQPRPWRAVGPNAVQGQCRTGSMRTRDRHGDVGDEPLLLAAFAPVWVARDRAAGVKRGGSGRGWSWF